MPNIAHRGALIGWGFFSKNHMHAEQNTAGAEIIAVSDSEQREAKNFSMKFNAKPFTDAKKKVFRL